jgi:hypothetical protein
MRDGSDSTGIARALPSWVIQATFGQKVILCMIAGFLAAGLFEWGKLFIEGADDALNKGYQHRGPAQITSGP